MIRQVSFTAGGSRRKRARKQSNPRRASLAVVRAPRNLRYDGLCKMARTTTANLTVQGTSGFQLGAAAFATIMLTFSPQKIKFWGDSSHTSEAILPQYAELAAVWDRIKIVKVELDISSNLTDSAAIAHGTQPAIGEAPAYNAPRIIIANDYTGPVDGNQLSTSDVQQMTDAKTYVLSSDQPSVKWTVYPRYQRLIQFTDIDSAFEPARGFIESASDVPHLGTKLGIQNIGFCSSCRIQINAKYFLELKNVK